MTLFHERLWELRQSRGLSQPAVAKAAGVTTRTYQRYEAGEREPDVTTIIRMVQFYGVSADNLLGLSNEENAK